MVYGFFGLIVIVPLIQEVFNLPVGETGLAGNVFWLSWHSHYHYRKRGCDAELPPCHATSLAGATRWQTIYKVVIPFSISGITSGVVLGIGRAIGRTMAVLIDSEMRP